MPCSEKIRYDVWAGLEEEVAGRFQTGTSVCLGQSCSPEPTERAGSKGPRWVHRHLRGRAHRPRWGWHPGLQLGQLGDLWSLEEEVRAGHRGEAMLHGDGL